MFADTISSIVSDANEEGRSEGRSEGRLEERNLIKKATKAAKDNNISNVSDLEALGFDKDTAEGAISILTELGIIS